MTLEEARERIGQPVGYRPRDGQTPEFGVITSVNERFVFVRYGDDRGSKATRPEDLRGIRFEPEGPRIEVGMSRAHDAACPAQRVQFPPDDAQPDATGSPQAQLLRGRR